ncbi:MAG: hypothetical protein ACJARN_001768 [Arenicella sp.]
MPLKELIYFDQWDQQKSAEEDQLIAEVGKLGE